MKIAIGCDHVGIKLRNAVLDYLTKHNFEITDFGAYELDKDDDYPDVAFKVARSVANKEAEAGILLCGTGFGISIAANKIQGIRSIPCNDINSAKMAKAHNNINIITMGGNVITPEQVEPILDTYFNTQFEGGRHIRRINKISMAENSTMTAPFNGQGKVVIFNHPLVQHKIGKIRDVNTDDKLFRELVQEISGLMVYEITRTLPLSEIEVQTPIAKTTARILKGKELAIVPVLRAGLGMVDGILRLVPNAKVGHIGLYRDPDTLKPVEYYCKLPGDIAEREVFVVDPMLATGGSAADAIALIKKRGGKKISFVCLFAAPEGIEKLHKEHPEVDIYIAALDSHVNEHGYIVPGLGDAGDRLFGTK